MQVDFTTIKRGNVQLKAFVATLGNSRASYIRFTETERQEDWLEGLVEAFNYFDGVTKEVLFDNVKCIMLERDAYGEGRHRWNPKLLELAQTYGFKPKACRPYRAKTKGKVERFNGYLKNSFITPLVATLNQVGLDLDVHIANAHIGAWLDGVANQRIHATTKELPNARLAVERLHLMPLPCKTNLQSSVIVSTACTIPVESYQHPLSVYDQLLGMPL